MLELDIIKYSVKDLNAFRLKRKEIKRIITGDRSLSNIFDEISNFAVNPAHKNLKTIPKTVLETAIARTNKYREEVLKFDSSGSDIADYETFKVAIDEALIATRVDSIKKAGENLVRYVEFGDSSKAKYELEKMYSQINVNVEEVSQDQVFTELSEYYAYTSASRTSTGFKGIDKMIDGGLIKGQIMTIAGESGVGKTWAATNYIFRTITSGEKICLLSNEMTRVEMFNRLLAVARELPETEIERQGWGDAEGEGLENKSFIKSILKDCAIYDNCHRIERIEAIVEKMTSEHNIWLFVVDHFHNMMLDKKNEGESQAYLAHEFQRIAQQYGVTFILLAQLAKNDYGEKKASPKGRGELVDVSNFIFTLTHEEKKQDHSYKDTAGHSHRYVKNQKLQTIITVTATKIRRGYKGTSYWMQDFEKGGVITECQ